MSEPPSAKRPPVPPGGLLAGIPPELRWSRPLRLPEPLAECELSSHLLELTVPNTHLDEAVCFLGGGTYDHYVPALVDAIAASVGSRLIAPDSPQPFLQAVFELQTLFASLAGLGAASAPFADAPTALVEAIRMAARLTGRRQAVLARALNPSYRAIAQTLLNPRPIACDEVGYHGGITRPGDVERALSDGTACVVIEQPNFFGCLEDVPALAAAAHRNGALLIAKVDPISLALLAPPGESGADIAIADAQALGSRPGYGGSSVGLLAARADLATALPGWRVERRGEAFEAAGVCASPVAADRVVRPVAYLAAVGSDGLARAARLSVAAAHELQRRVCSIEGFSPRFRAPFFKEFAVEAEADAEEVMEALLESNILGALPLQPHYPEMENCLLFAATERRTKADLDLLHHALELLGDADIGGDFALDSDDA
jgi:glycine dehydrogenase subunit 1